MRRASRSCVALLLAACWSPLACSGPAQERPARSAAAGAPRPATWAQRLTISESLPNLHRVTPTLYRGAQPDDRGFTELRRLGVETVVNLRLLGSDRSETEDNDLAYVHIAQEAWDAEDDEILAFLRVAIDPASQPVFVHCQHGADRTGVSVAAYRVVVQGWSKAEAIREMTQGDFGFHSIWSNLIGYIEELDVDRMRSELGLAARTTARTSR